MLNVHVFTQMALVGIWGESDTLYLTGNDFYDGESDRMPEFLVKDNPFTPGMNTLGLKKSFYGK